MQKQQFALHAEIENEHWWFLGRREIITGLVTSLISPSKETFVVDVGCGTGGNIADLSTLYTCVGIDPSQEAIALAEKRFPHVTFYSGELPGAFAKLSGQADLLLMMDVLEHVEDDSALFADVLAHVKRGGHLLITVPADMSLWSSHDETFGHHRRYDIHQLRQLWQDHSVSEKLCSYYNARLYLPVKLIRKVKRMAPQRTNAGDTDFRKTWPPLNRVLKHIFAGEAKRLNAILAGSRRQGYKRGVSLIAILERQ